jgi:hypothetical protein
MEAANKFNQIEMFNENLGTKSIEDFNYGQHINGKMINVVVKDHLSISKAEEKEAKHKQKMLEQ